MIAHSYMAVTPVLYAMQHPARIDRIVQLGPMAPRPGTEYPAHLTAADETLRNVQAALARLQTQRAAMDPEEFCRRFWSLLRVIYVVDPADAERIRWGRCDLSNERGFMKHWIETLRPSLHALDLRAEALANVTTPVLTIHGRRDRSAPYGAGREWAGLLPAARLVTVENAGHAPWIESPGTVFGSIAAFLDGRWPESAEKVIVAR